jgi:glycosyltransferase involved in cell wall biosynthesis
VRLLIDLSGPVGSDTGAATYARYMLPLWQKTGDDLVAVFSHEQTPAELRDLPAVRELPRPAIGGGGGKVVDLQLGVRKVLRAERFDAAYFPGNFMPIPLPRSTPSVVAVRSTLLYHYPAQMSASRRVYRRAATKYAVRAADRLIVPSSAIADDLMRFVDAARTKIVVVPHGVDLDRFRPDSTVTPDPGRFLFVSKPWDYKGLATTLRALARLVEDEPDSDARLMIADGGLAELERAIASRGLRDIGKRTWETIADGLDVRSRVEFLGKLSHEQLSDEYRRASALVSPTSCESFGNPSLEAAASGCPVITGFGHGIDETIGPVAFQVRAHRHDELAEAMAHCAALTTEARADQVAALRDWANRFSWEKALNETRAVLREIAR